MNNDKIHFEESLLDIIEEELLSESKSDILEIYSKNSIEEIEDFKSTQSIVNNALTQHKKNKLIAAREQLEIIHSASNTIHSPRINPKDFIISLITKGLMPASLGLTFAMRDGVDIPDEDVESIIEDLKELGIEMEDE